MKTLDQKIVQYKDEHHCYEFQDIAKKALYLVKNNEEIKNECASIIKDVIKKIIPKIFKYQITRQ